MPRFRNESQNGNRDRPEKSGQPHPQFRRSVSADGYPTGKRNAQNQSDEKHGKSYRGHAFTPDPSKPFGRMNITPSNHKRGGATYQTGIGSKKKSSKSPKISFGKTALPSQIPDNN